MHYFVVKFSKLIRLRRQGGVDPPNQNHADALARRFEYSLGAASPNWSEIAQTKMAILAFGCSAEPFYKLYMNI